MNNNIRLIIQATKVTAGSVGYTRLVPRAGERFDSTFNIPDIRGEFQCIPSMGSSFYTLEFVSDARVYGLYYLIDDGRGNGLLAIAIAIPYNMVLVEGSEYQLLNELRDTYIKNYMTKYEGIMIDQDAKEDPLLFENIVRRYELQSDFEGQGAPAWGASTALVRYHTDADIAMYLHTPFRREYEGFSRIFFVSEKLQFRKSDAKSIQVPVEEVKYYSIYCNGEATQYNDRPSNLPLNIRVSKAQGFKPFVFDGMLETLKKQPGVVVDERKRIININYVPEPLSVEIAFKFINARTNAELSAEEINKYGITLTDGKNSTYSFIRKNIILFKGDDFERDWKFAYFGKYVEKIEPNLLSLSSTILQRVITVYPLSDKTNVISQSSGTNQSGKMDPELMSHSDKLRFYFVGSGVSVIKSRSGMKARITIDGKETFSTQITSKKWDFPLKENYSHIEFVFTGVQLETSEIIWKSSGNQYEYQVPLEKKRFKQKGELIALVVGFLLGIGVGYLVFKEDVTKKQNVNVVDVPPDSVVQKVLNVDSNSVDSSTVKKEVETKELTDADMERTKKENEAKIRVYLAELENVDISFDEIKKIEKETTDGSILMNDSIKGASKLKAKIKTLVALETIVRITERNAESWEKIIAFCYSNRKLTDNGKQLTPMQRNAIFNLYQRDFKGVSRSDEDLKIIKNNYLTDRKHYKKISDLGIKLKR